MSLHVKAILTHHGIGGLGGYDSCTELEESIIHVLSDCPIAKYFWEHSSCLDSLKQPFSDDLMVWIKKNALDSSKVNDKDYDWCNFFFYWACGICGCKGIKSLSSNNPSTQI